MNKYLVIGQKIENIVIAVTFILMVLLAFAQVVNRNIVGYSISWFEEIARYCMVYMALLGTEVGLRDGSQIAITAVVDKFPRIPRSILNIITKMIIISFSVAIFFTSLILLENQIALGQTSPAFGLPMYVPYAALPGCFALIALVQSATMIMMIVDLFSNKLGSTDEENCGIDLEKGVL